MSNSARITQADMQRACNAVRAAGFERAKIVMNLELRTIEIIIGDLPDVAPVAEPNEWLRE